VNAVRLSRLPLPERGVLAALLLLCAAGCRPEGDVAVVRPNIVLVTLDTLRADHLGAYGHPEPVSPHFDALAERGVLFDRAVAASSRTAPSHATIMTSRYVRDHSIGHRNGSTRLEGAQTLARSLSAAGYDTAAFVSNTMLQRRIGLDGGFDVYDDELPDRERSRPVFERRALRTTDRAVAWLEAAEPPYFLWVHYNDPHGPYTPPRRHRRFSGMASGSVPPREDALPALDQQRGWHGIPAYQVLGDLRLPRSYRALYTAEVRYVDEALGTLLRSAENASGRKGLAVLVTSDHGESLGEEGFYFSHGHATTPDLCHVPMLLVAPGLRPGRSHDLVHHVDVMPTLLEIAGIEPPEESAGVPLGRHWRSGTALHDRVVFADVGAEVAAYSADRFQRIRLEGDLGDTPEGSRKTYRWLGDGTWAETAVDPVTRSEVVDYLARQVRLSQAEKPGGEDEERLRALGYLEPVGDEPTSDSR
jgi:arylsulfatase